MTSDPIRAAIEQLRADVEALPEYLRDDAIVRARPATWTAVGPYVTVAGYGVAAHAAEPEAAAHIALTASPHVTEALIALLQALHDHGEQGPIPDDVQVALDALATAITRRPE